MVASAHGCENRTWLFGDDFLAEGVLDMQETYVALRENPRVKQLADAVLKCGMSCALIWWMVDHFDLLR